MAGTKHDLDQAEHLRKKWVEQGLDQVFLQPYNVQLSKPNPDKPNKVNAQETRVWDGKLCSDKFA